MEKPKLLIIDDDKEILKSLEDFFSDEFDVDIAETIENGTKLLISKKYPVAIVDMDFPKKPEGGLELAHYIEEKDIQTKIIIFTAFHTERQLEKAQKTKVYAYIEKGENTKELYNVVKDALAAFNHLLIKEPSKDTFFNETEKKAMPCAIKRFEIKDYKRIKYAGISGIPADTQWILLTGNNGFGKTAILQALTIGLNGNRDENEILGDDDFKIEIELKENEKNRINRVSPSNGDASFKKFKNLAAYGPARLEIQAPATKNKVSGISKLTHSLFHTDGALLNIEHELSQLYSFKNPKFNMIKQAMLDALPYVHDIRIDQDGVQYVEKEDEKSEKAYPPLPFEKLGAGQKNIIAMIGDMLIRFSKSQPDAEKTEDFCGIAIIDEMDNHLHPKWQKRLPSILSSIFPKVQFIAATHSVIPFLGVPEKSVFLKVLRTMENGIFIERKNVSVRNLTPDTLLSSPLFDLEEITHIDAKDISDVRTDGTWQKIELNDKIKAALRDFEKSDKDFPDDLFEPDDLFKPDGLAGTDDPLVKRIKQNDPR